jgi:hypothetical protein
VLGVDVCAQDGAIATCGADKTIKIYRRRANAVNGHTQGGAEHVEQQNDNPLSVANGTGSAEHGENQQLATRDTAITEG